MRLTKSGWKGTLLLLCALTFVTAGCEVSCGPVRNQDGTIVTGQQTPLQRVIKLNAEVAKTNLALEQITERLHAGGTINDQQARILIKISLGVAQTSDTIRLLTSSPGDWSSVATGILKSIDSLGLTAKINASGITNPQILMALQAVVSVVDLIRLEVRK